LRTDDEVKRFLLAAREEGERVFVFYAVAVYTGLRAGELAALEGPDVDFDRRLITVQRSFDGPTQVRPGAVRANSGPTLTGPSGLNVNEESRLPLPKRQPAWLILRKGDSKNGGGGEVPAKALDQIQQGKVDGRIGQKEAGIAEAECASRQIRPPAHKPTTPKDRVRVGRCESYY
jgi:integrase